MKVFRDILFVDLSKLLLFSRVLFYELLCIIQNIVIKNSFFHCSHFYRQTVAKEHEILDPSTMST